MLLLQGSFIISTAATHENRFAKNPKLLNYGKDQALAELKQITPRFPCLNH